MEKRISLLAYTTFIFVGILFSIAYVALKDIAVTFKVDTSVINYILAFFLIGNSASIFLSGFLLHKINIKKLLFLAYTVIGVGMIGVALSVNLVLFGIFMGFAGLGIGVLVASTNHILVSLYKDDERRYKLNILNFFYGFGSIICPIIVGNMLKLDFSWRYVYFVFLVFLITLYVLAFRIDFSVIKDEKHDEIENKVEFSKNIILIGIAIAIYVASEVILTSWLVTYMRESIMLDVLAASFSLTMFWIFMSAGRLLSGFLSDKIKLEKYILSSMLLALLSVATFLATKNVAAIFVFIAIAGIAFSGLYASLLTYGTKQVEHVPPAVTTFFITMGAVGSLMSSPVSSVLKQTFGVKTAMISTVLFMFVSMVLIILTIDRKRS